MSPTRLVLGDALALAAGCQARGTSDDSVDRERSGSLAGPATKPPKKHDASATADTAAAIDTAAATDTAATDARADAGARTYLDACLLPGSVTATFLPYGGIWEGDEGATSALPLPFSFTFLGTTYAHYWVTSNGEVGFGTAPGGPAFGRVRCPLPDAQVAQPIVFVYATDLLSSTVCMATTGTAPNRKLVVTWKDAHLYEIEGSGNGTSNLAFGATFSEGTHAIELNVHRADITTHSFPAEPIIQGSWATVGLQSGAAAVSFSCQQPHASPGSSFLHQP